jgi:hypothetical protein
MIAKRMVQYCKAHNFDKDDSHLVRIFAALRSHLCKARGKSDGSMFDIFDVQDTATRMKKLSDLQFLQRELNTWGVTEVVLTAIATHPAGSEGNAADEGLELLQEMALYGNVVVQNAIMDWVNFYDKDNNLMQYFRERLLLSQETIRLRKQITKVDFEPLTEQEREEFVNAQQTYKMLKTLCEGHNLTCQEMLRVQPLINAADVNVVALAADFVVYQAEDGMALKRMEDLEVELVFDALECLIEMVQGPCGGNQEVICAHTPLINLLDTIIGSPFHGRVSKDLRLKVKANAVSLLASCKVYLRLPIPKLLTTIDSSEHDARCALFITATQQASRAATTFLATRPSPRRSYPRPWRCCASTSPPCTLAPPKIWPARRCKLRAPTAVAPARRQQEATATTPSRWACRRRRIAWTRSWPRSATSRPSTPSSPACRVSARSSMR